MTSFAQQLLEVPAREPDREVARLIAGALLESERQPYRFAIDHDTRPPKCLPCPFDYDWVLKNRVGIETRNRETAERWIVQALLKGYTVERYTGNKPDGGHSGHIGRARNRAEYHQRPKSENDDDIPF